MADADPGAPPGGGAACSALVRARAARPMGLLAAAARRLGVLAVGARALGARAAGALARRGLGGRLGLGHLFEGKGRSRLRGRRDGKRRRPEGDGEKGEAKQLCHEGRPDAGLGEDDSEASRGKRHRVATVAGRPSQADGDGLKSR
jgi:hypothetical protein